jgi:hypothetical protein
VHFGIYFCKKIEKNAPNAKNIAQLANFRPIWSHWPRATTMQDCCCLFPDSESLEMKSEEEEEKKEKKESEK